MSARILLTGGAGFIGSHTYAALAEAGHDVTILDNFENAHRDVPERLSLITGQPVEVVECDIRDADGVMAAFDGRGFDAVVHFAARKSIPESEADPVGYAQSNCSGLVNVVTAMRAHGVNAIVFSSSAAVYGNTDQVPIREETPLAPMNTYARTKAFGEGFLSDVARSDPAFHVGILRYFNPVGAHPSGLIGEDPSQMPTNLVPVIARVATGQLEELLIYGGDYPTPDGTGIRDYIHVQDLAHGHVLSLDALLTRAEGHLVNLGTGRGYSVQEVLASYEAACGRKLAHRIVGRRAGDAAISYANVDLAQEVLGFSARHGLQEMCESNWRFFRRNHQRADG